MPTHAELAVIVKQAFDATANVLGSEQARLVPTRKNLLKQAEFGANQTPQFEKAFGAIAYTYLQEKAPGLIPYIVGFQMLERDSETDNAAGVFVAQVGDKIIDIPVFFVDNELKGHYVMRLREPELFLPLREAFIDYLFSRMPQDLGDAVPQDQMRSPVPNQPDMQVFDPVKMLKAGAEEYLDPWARQYKVASAFADMRCRPENLKLALHWLKKESSKKIVDLVELISTSESMLRSAAELGDNYLDFASKMAKFYGKEWIKTAAEKFMNRKALASAPIGMDIELELNDSPIVKQAKLAWYSDPSHLATEEAKKELLTYGAFVLDKRAAEETAEAVKVQKFVDVEGPMETGVYKVMMPDNEFKQVMVVLCKDLFTNHCQQDLVIDTSSKKVALVDHDNYLVAKEQGPSLNEPRIDFNKLLGQINDSPAAGDIGIFITEKGESTGLVMLKKKLDDGNFETGYVSTYRLEISRSKNMRAMHEAPTYANNGQINFIRYYPVKSGKYIQRQDDALLLPDNAKFLRLAKESLDPMGPDVKLERLDIQPTASLSFSELNQRTNLSMNKIAEDKYELNGYLFNRAEARDRLLANCCLHKSAAEQILAESIGRHAYIVGRPGEDITLHKLASQYDAPYLPFPQMQGPTSGPTGNYMIQMDDQQEVQAPMDPTRIPMQEGETPEDRIYGPNGSMGSMGGPGGVNLNEMPEDGGLFDVSGLQAILQNNRVDSDIRAFSKSLLSSIDKLGRLIFIFNAHKDEFIDIYGEAELKDLEAQMISNFETAGNLFISLTRKSANPNPDLDISTLQAGL